MHVGQDSFRPSCPRAALYQMRRTNAVNAQIALLPRSSSSGSHLSSDSNRVSVCDFADAQNENRWKLLRETTFPLKRIVTPADGNLWKKRKKG